MKTTLRAGFLTLFMTALSTAPVVVITTLASADAAYAKGGNGGGKGGGKGAGRDHAAEMKLKGGKGQGGKSEARRGGPKTLGEFFSSLTGEDRKTKRPASSRSQSAKKTVPMTTEAPAKRGAKLVAGLHPSQLGNMNAAYNANMNAILAHVRNGNLNGPVGAMAGLAIATSTSEISAEDARAARELAMSYEAAAALLEGTVYEGATAEDTVRAYFNAVNVNPDNAIDGVDLGEIGLVADDNSLKSYPADDLEKSGDILAAEDALIETWNKSDAANDEDRVALLDALNARFEGQETAIAEAIDEGALRAASKDDDGAECDTETELCGTTPETVAAID